MERNSAETKSPQEKSNPLRFVDGSHEDNCRLPGKFVQKVDQMEVLVLEGFEQEVLFEV